MSQQFGHNHCACGHLDAHHRAWEKHGIQSCRLCECEQFILASEAKKAAAAELKESEDPNDVCADCGTSGPHQCPASEDA